MKHILRYGVPADKDFIRRTKGLISGIVYPGHIAADQQSSLPPFVASTSADYFIDPDTYALSTESPGLVRKRGDELKRSWRKYLDIVFDKIDLDLNLSGGMRLHPQWFLQPGGGLTPDGEIFCRNILRLQNILGQEDEDLRKYREIALEQGVELDIPVGTKGPNRILAPYFPISHMNDSWLHVNHEIWGKTRELVDGNDLYFVLCLEEEFEGTEQDIINWVTDNIIEPNGFAVWVGGLNERDAFEGKLNMLSRLIKGLSTLGKPIFNLYGGQFSMLLGPEGLREFCSGPGYGEARATNVGSGAGAPPNRYYMPEILNHVTAPDLRIASLVHNWVCKCEYCSSYGQLEGEEISRHFFGDDIGSSSASQANSDGLKNHFISTLSSQRAELKGLDISGRNKWLDNLIERSENDFYALYTTQGPHLTKWKAVLESI